MRRKRLGVREYSKEIKTGGEKDRDFLGKSLGNGRLTGTDGVMLIYFYCSSSSAAKGYLSFFMVGTRGAILLWMEVVEEVIWLIILWSGDGEGWRNK